MTQTTETTETVIDRTRVGAAVHSVRAVPLTRSAWWPVTA
jgi:hypothetical protein